MRPLRVQGRYLTCSDIVAQSIKRSDNYLRFYVFRNCEPNMNPLLILFAAQLVQAMSAPQPGSCHVTLVERAQIGHGQSGLDHLKSDLLGPIKKAKDAFVQVAVAEVGYQFVRANVPALGTYASNANVLRHVKVAKDALCTNLCRSGFGKQVCNRLVEPLYKAAVDLIQTADVKAQKILILLAINGCVSWVYRAKQQGVEQPMRC
jgi:hypothetical protein